MSVPGYLKCRFPAESDSGESGVRPGNLRFECFIGS